MKKVVNTLLTSALLGLVMGCTMFVLIGIFWDIISPALPFEGQYGFVKQALCSMGVSLGFTIPAIVYKSKKIAFPLQVVIHMATGFVIFGFISYFAGWIPFEEGAGAVVLFAAIAVVSSALIWLGFYLRAKMTAKKINKIIAEKQGEEK